MSDGQWEAEIKHLDNWLQSGGELAAAAVKALLQWTCSEDVLPREAAAEVMTTFIYTKLGASSGTDMTAIKPLVDEMDRYEGQAVGFWQSVTGRRFSEAVDEFYDRLRAHKAALKGAARAMNPSGGIHDLLYR